MPRRARRAQQAASRAGRRRARARVCPAQRVAVDPSRIAPAGLREPQTRAPRGVFPACGAGSGGGAPAVRRNDEALRLASSLSRLGRRGARGSAKPGIAASRSVFEHRENLLPFEQLAAAERLELDQERQAAQVAAQALDQPRRRAAPCRPSPARRPRSAPSAPGPPRRRESRWRRCRTRG